MDLDDTANPPLDWALLDWHGYQVQLIGGIFQLTLQPTAAIATVSDLTLTNIAKKCVEINQKGVPILLRYGHEMNGDWAQYAIHPIQYITGFQRLSSKIKQYTNLTGIFLILW